LQISFGWQALVNFKKAAKAVKGGAAVVSAFSEEGKKGKLKAAAAKDKMTKGKSEGNSTPTA